MIASSSSWAAACASAFSSADSAAALVNALTSALDTEKATCAVLQYDAKRHVVLRHQLGSAIGVSSTPSQDVEPARTLVALDHLPVPVRKAVEAGGPFARVGDQSRQYAALLGLDVPAEDVRLLLKGIVIDHALTAVLAVCVGGSRLNAKLAERIELGGMLFELAYARLYHQEARREAVDVLHDITERLRTTHGNTVAAMEREIARLRETRGGAVDQDRLTQLQVAVESAEQRAAHAEHQLTVVEQQVSNAVERLERAHVQLHQQTETVRLQAETIRRLEAQIEARSPSDTLLRTPLDSSVVTPAATPISTSSTRHES